MRYLRSVFLVSLVIMALDSFGQEPIYTPMRSNYKFRGVRIDSLFMMPSFPDTTTANTLDIANINGNFIRIDTSLYVRYNQKWYLINSNGGGASSVPNLQQVTDVGNTTTNDIYSKNLNNTIGLKDTNNIAISTLINDHGAGYLQIKNTYDSNLIELSGQYLVFYDNKLGKEDDHSLYVNNDTIGSFTNTLPNQSGTLALSVNGNFADSKGNISVSGIDTTSLSNRINAKADTSAVNLKLNISDTTNKWVNNVVSISDSAFRVIKGATNTDITIKSVSTSISTTKLITAVWNNTGATIPRGAVVYINGAHSSNLPTIALAKSNNEATSAYTYGLVQDSIPDNKSGIVIQNGTISNLNLPTLTYTDGQTLYLSPTVAGGYTTTKPTAPNHYVAIGTVTRAHPQFGQIQVAIRNGFQLDEMSDVKIAAVPADSVLLQFSRVDSLWHDVSVTTAIGGRYLKPSDTASLSNRINAKLTASDTASLSNRINAKLTASDTASLSNRINTKLTASDTASLSNRINTKLTASDTASLSNRINTKLTASDTTSLSNRINTKLTASDTASLSTRINARVLLSDSNVVYATRHRIDTMRTNVYGAINTKIGGSGSTGSLSKFTASGTIGNASVDVDYLQQDMSLVAMQAMGSSIKGYNIGAPIPTALATTFTMTSQQLFIAAIYVPKSVTLTGVRWLQVTNGSFTANNYNGVALYTVSGGTLTLVDSSTRDGNCWQQGTGWRNKDFVTPYSASAGIYYVGVLYSSSAQTTAPAIATSGSTSGTFNANATFDFTNSQRAGGTLASQTALPTSQALSGTSTNGNRIGVYLY